MKGTFKEQKSTRNISHLSEKIAKLCIETFDLQTNYKFKKHAPEDEYMILAGIVLCFGKRELNHQSECGQDKPTEYRQEILQEDNEFERRCVAFGSGQKCLGSKSIRNSGHVIFDSHAEVLCRRAFIKYIYDEMLNCLFLPTSTTSKDSTEKYQTDIQNNKSGSDVLEWNGEKFKFRDGISVHFYVSTSPCGDASMEATLESQTEEERLENVTKKREYGSKIHQYHHPSNSNDGNCDNQHKSTTLDNLKVYRGREDYSKKGVLRTKPGRIDSDPTLSLSCSDKLIKWMLLGMNGSLQSSLLETPIYIDYLHIGSLYHTEGLQRAFQDRIETRINLLKTDDFQKNIFAQTWSNQSLIEKKEANSNLRFKGANVCQVKHPVFPYSKEAILNRLVSEHDEYIDEEDNGILIQNEIIKTPKISEINPSDTAMVWSFSNDKQNKPEYLVQGSKKGATKKVKGTKKSRSTVSKSYLFEMYIGVLKRIKKNSKNERQVDCEEYNEDGVGDNGKTTVSYHEWKMKSIEYQLSKRQLLFGLFPEWNHRPVISTFETNLSEYVDSFSI